MLKLLRKKGVAKKLIWAVAIVIIISFGFLGTAYLLTDSGGTSYAGKIYGKKISVEDFNKVYKNARIQAIRQYGTNLNKVAHLLNLEAQTWDRLILLRETKKRKIKIPNEQIVSSIEEDTSFQRNNQFDVLLYNSILRSLQVRPRDYEENVRDNLKIKELFKQVTTAVTLSEDEVFQEYKNLNEKVQVSYVLVPSDSFKENVLINPSDMEQYYNDHKNEFLMPPAVNVQYLMFDFPESEESEDNPDAEDLLEQAKDNIREKTDNIFQELLVNPNMQEIAQQNNIKVKTTGFFSMEQPNLTLGWSYDLLNKIFEMGPNEINAPFETASGISIIQIKERRDSYVPPFSETKDKVIESVTDMKSKEIAQEKSFQYLNTIREKMENLKIKDFSKTAKELQLEIYQTPIFNRGQYLPQVGISKEFQETAFSLTEDTKLSNVIETEKGYCILYLDNYVPVDKSEYEQSKEELAQTISDEKQNSVFGDYVMQLRLEADLVNNIPQLRSGGTQ